MKRSKEEAAIMSRIENLREELARQERLLEEERVKLAGIAIGDIVLCEGERYRVARVDVNSWGGKPWLMANPTKKDGTFWTALRRLFSDWEREGQAQ
ncbi:hypothetical protein [Paraburkholderia tropica]|uniref:hypothetical protein n=1 Tax=Paraburkholderia tropica TaxID=92647 RepID=UPI003D2DEB18